ncbi:MAG: hypothetical protein E6R03_09735 [Hyphomicrobiaceae bacterium]|nr:MAG: hypothetical protein E6R03_09735 [Hyphomicrobiaceae bacterium]
MPLRRGNRLRAISARTSGSTGGAILDKVGAATVAYSTRRVRTAYTGSALRVRRSSDNVEQDIGFTSSGDLNTSSLTSFIGANSAFVVTWYDQSGNGRDATMATTANQPRIVNAGSVDVINTRPVLIFDGVNDRLALAAASLTLAPPFTRFITAQYLSKTSKSVLFDSETSTEPVVFYNGESAGQFVSTTGVSPSTVAVNIGTSNLNFNVFAHLIGSSTIDPYTNGTLQTSAGSQGNSLKGLSIGNIRTQLDNTYSFNGAVAEVILLPSSVASGTRSLVERNSGAYYGITVA